jgi:mono/diheme cytochrome c family protein
VTAAVLSGSAQGRVESSAGASGQTAQGDVGKGRVLFAKYCAGCHGASGQGDGYRLLGPQPADLTSPSTTAKSDAALLAAIHAGKPNMPARGQRMTEEASHDVLAYVRTLERR